MKDRQTITRKIQLYPIGDKEEVQRVYKFIRDAQYSQYITMNTLMGQIASKYYECGRDIKNEEFKDRLRNNYHNPLLDDIEYQTGLGTKALLTHRIQSDFMNDVKNGLAKGERAIRNYKRDMPVMTAKTALKFKHPYSGHTEFLEHLYKQDLEVYLHWVNKIQFRVVFGNPHRSAELRSVLKNIFEENYLVQQSGIQFDKTGKKIMINLCLSIPVKEHVLKEDTVVGVYFGETVPAVCGVNNNQYAIDLIGSSDELRRMRTKIKAQRSRLQSSLRDAKGGHGRKEKLRALDRVGRHEAHFVRTYNHMITKRIIDFALQNEAKYIYMEDMDEKENALLQGSFYMIQQFLEYKASLHGIIVQKVKVIDVPTENETISIKTESDLGKQVALSKDFV